MKAGWIKLFRKVQDNAIYKDSELLHIWTHCLLNASWEDKEVYFNGSMVRIRRGELIVGRDKLQERTGINGMTAYRKLNVLQKMGNVNIKANNRYSVVSVVNYDAYQGEPDEDEQPNDSQTTAKRQESEQPNDTTKKKRSKEEKKVRGIHNFNNLYKGANNGKAGKDHKAGQGSKNFGGKAGQGNSRRRSLDRESRNSDAVRELVKKIVQ